MKSHPAAEIFPLMIGAEFDALIADIREHGQRDPIVLLDGKILDGRNRFRACEALGIKPNVANWDGAGTPEGFVVSHNLHRRHLNESQRALIGARLATLKKGYVKGQMESGQGIPRPLTQAAAAEMLNVNATTLSDAKTVLANAAPTEIAAIQSGDLTVNRVAKQIRAGIPAEERPQRRAQSAVVANARRVRTQNVNGQVWALFRDALTNLTSLPSPQDAARIARGMDKAGLVDKRLASALNYLKEFSDAWNANG